MLRYAVLGLIVASAAVGVAQAQSKKGPNGGLLAKSHDHPIEFVVKGQDLVFYLSDHDGSPMATKGMAGRATFQDGGKTTTVPLAPSDPNLLVGKAQAPLGPKARVVFSAKLQENGHTHTLTARFVTD